MRLFALSTLLLAGCGLDMMGNGGSELAAPSVSALTRAADGTEAVRLTWSDAAVTRAYLEQAKATSSDAWLVSTSVPSERELQLVFAQGFAAAMAGRAAYSVSLSLPDQSKMHSCACCRHSSHVVKVDLTFDHAGALTDSSVTQVVK